MERRDSGEAKKGKGGIEERARRVKERKRGQEGGRMDRREVKKGKEG